MHSFAYEETALRANDLVYYNFARLSRHVLAVAIFTSEAADLHLLAGAFERERIARRIDDAISRARPERNDARFISLLPQSSLFALGESFLTMATVRGAYCPLLYVA